MKIFSFLLLSDIYFFFQSKKEEEKLHIASENDSGHKMLCVREKKCLKLFHNINQSLSSCAPD